MSQEKKNKIAINGKEIEVKIKQLTFFDVQAVAPLLSDGSLDFSSYWRHAFTHWLAYDSQFDMEHISPSEGAALAALLPEPNEVMEWLLFREPKSAKSNISSTGDPLVTDFATNEKGWNTF
jgi:hypothetical protein|tara:strand:+ start:1013 stop:1375 length:363 start_codon:yes stop_codon:yes gene_type:complete